MAAETDFTRYLDARWADLVSGLEAEGVDPDAARQAVAEALLGRRGSWAQRVRSEQVDQTLWAELRERTSLPPRPGAVAPHAGRALDPADLPEPWLQRAEVIRGARRRRSARLALAGAALAVVAGAGWGWWASLPSPPPVRAEVNTLAVPWYAAGDLHLAEVVVELRGVSAFAAQGDDVVVQMTSGEVQVVRADGDVDDLDEAGAELTEVLAAGSSLSSAGVPLGRYDVILQSVPTADGGTAHLLDSSRRTDDRGALRLSESGRRAVVICDPDGVCEPPQTLVTGSQSIRLG